MKRYFTQLTALTALLALATGCQKESEGFDGPANTAMAEVNVSVDGLRIDTKDSRAVVGDMPDFAKNGFKIVGYYTVGTDYVDDTNPGKSGHFDDNTMGLLPNLFDYKGDGQPTEGDAVRTLTPVDGKFKVSLSAWKLLDNSYLSYFAWASNVDAGVAENAAANPIKSSTGNSSSGAPFIQVLVGSTTSPLNVDVVAAKSADNHNDVVRSSIDMNFKHVLSKLKFTVKNTIGIDIKLSGATIKFAASKVYRGGTYTFDGDPSYVGTWGSYTDNTAANYAVATSATLAPSTAATPLDEQLIIPQTLAGGDISVELTYTIPSLSTTAVYTRTVPLRARTFEQNTSYTYEISLSESQITINEGMIGAWLPTDTGLPNVAGEQNASVLLLLDAYDAPYTHIDGTKYWLDRSGWNRHVKLVGGVTYNSSEKKYVFDGATTTYGEIISPFTATSATTIETIVSSTRGNGSGSQQLFTFNSDGGSQFLRCHFNNGGESYYYYTGNSSEEMQAKIPLSLYNDFALYSFTQSSSSQGVYRNLIYNNRRTPSTTYDLSKATTRQIALSFQGELKFFKITATAKTSINSADYASLSKRYKLKDTDYVDDGLLVDLRGTDAPVGNTWVERITGASVPISGYLSYSSSNKEYTVNNSVTFDFKSKYAGMSVTTLTMEMLGYVTATTTGIIGEQVNFAGVSGFRFQEYDGQLQFLSPNSYPDFFTRINYGNASGSNLPTSKKERRSYAGIRKNVSSGNVELTGYRDNVLRLNPTALTTVPGAFTAAPDKLSLTGGNNKFVCTAVRFYNRALTTSELTWNYNIDKMLYSIY